MNEKELLAEAKESRTDAAQPTEVVQQVEKTPTKAASAPPDAATLLSKAAAQQVESMIIKATERLAKQLGDLTAALKQPAAQRVTQEQVHLQETRSPNIRPTLLPLPEEFIDKRYAYRFVHKLKVYKRKAQGYEWVMHDECPVCEKDASGHVSYADTVLMRIPLTKVQATERENAAASSLRVGHLKEGFHEAVEAAKIPGVSSFETDKAGKEVF